MNSVGLFTLARQLILTKEWLDNDGLYYFLGRMLLVMKRARWPFMADVPTEQYTEHGPEGFIRHSFPYWKKPSGVIPLFEKVCMSIKSWRLFHQHHVNLKVKFDSIVRHVQRLHWLTQSEEEGCSIKPHTGLTIHWMCCAIPDACSSRARFKWPLLAWQLKFLT